MEKLIFLFIIFLVTAHGFAQTSYYELDDDHNGSGHVYTARDSVLLKAGFEYAAPTGFTFTGEIDESQIMDESYLENPIDPDTRGLNTNYAVGSINGSLNVTPTGAATYTIPIEVPPGTAGMQPQLSVGYNSQGGNGLMGMGWNLQGLSMITRTGTTLYHDGYIDGVDFDSNDQYVWDGQRLIFETTLSGGDKKYATESESFARIVAKSTSGNGPSWWEIYTKNGTRFLYGSEVDGKHEEQNSSSVVRWMLNKVIDRQGNYMTYHYSQSKSEGTWRIDRIEYTGNASSSPQLTLYNTVKFYYSERSDVAIGYVGGSKVKSDLLLRKIRTFAQGDFAHEYRFRYYDNGFTSQLNEITEVGHTGERLNSTVVGWGEEADEFEVLDISNVPLYLYENNTTYSSNQYYGDFTGDGLDDIFIAYHDHQYINNTNYFYGYKWRIYKSVGSGFSYHSGGSNTSTAYNFQYFVGDIDGDGMDDLYCISNVNSSQKQIDISISYGTGFSFYDLGNSPPYWTYAAENNFYLQGDFDGDGKSNLLIIRDLGSSNTEYLYIIDFNFDTQFSNTIIATKTISEADNENNISCYDFNGDGKTDILWLNESNEIIVWEFIEGQDVDESIVELFSGGFPTKGHECFWADFNGDRALDVLTYVDNSNLWELHLNDTKFSSDDCWNDDIISCPVSRDFDPDMLADNNYYTFDFNADGKSDILEIYKSTSNPPGYDYVLNLYASNGNGFETETTTVTSNLSCIYDVIRFVDFNGDNGMDCMFKTASIYSTPNAKMVSCFPFDQKNLVTQINNGLNQELTIEYEIGTNSNHYTMGGFTDHDYPVLPFDGKMNFVTQTQQDNGLGGYYTHEYNYHDGKIHLLGKGFLGFTEFESANTTLNQRTYQLYDYNASYFFPYLEKQESYAGQSPEVKLSTADHSYLTQGISGCTIRYLSLPATQTSTNHLNNIVITTNYNDYDDYGNVEELVVNHNGEGTTTTTTSYTGGIDNPAQCNYLPDYTTVATSRPGESTITINNDVDYSSNGLAWRKIAYAGTSDAVTSYFSYDDFGNLEDITVSATGVTSRQSTTTYDSRGRFPITQTNPLNWSESFEYDHRTGQVHKATDVNGHVTRYKYDGFGRSRLTEYPDGINLIEKIKWYTGPDVDNARYYTEAQATGSPPVRTWYDRVGRELKTQNTDFAGNYVYTKVEYDSKGRKHKVYEPYATSTGLYTEFTYDALGRSDETILPTGISLVTDYTDIDENKIRTYKEHTSSVWDDVSRTMNAFGQPVTIEEDAGGTITYTYTSAGQPKSITSNGSTIIMTYDIHGNRHTLNDPDATPAASGEDNLITTVYNAFDELTSQEDGRGKTYTMTYDKLGRITTRTGTETTTWTYSTTAGDLGELSSVSCNNNTSQSFAYDNLGRLTSQTENILGATFTQYYTYDDLGRLQSQSWNTGFGIKHRYNSHGYLSKVQTASDETIWEAESYNVRGQITNYLLGSDYRTVKSWDSYGLLTGIDTKTTDTPAVFEQQEDYDFDQIKGNLLERSIFETYDEGFTYDDLQRLTDETISSTTLSTTYADNGNISNRSDIGDYTYDNATTGPHAVTDLTNTVGNLLPTNDQRIDYTDFNKASHISQGNYDYFITYGPDRLRRKTVLDYDNGHPGEYTTLTKYYAFGDYEKETDANGTRHLHYIYGGDGLAAIYVKNDDGTDVMYYIMKDHLGSIVGAIDPETSNVYNQSFDAWGRNRNPDNWSYNSIPDDFPIARGFTGHEHLKLFGLINMNGRMYDVGLCRFLSPDPYVQMPDYTQNFNRYSYALNNPLIYTDPSGEFILPAIMLGAFINAGIQGAMGNLNSMGDFALALGIGAASGAAGAGAGAAVSGALGSATSLGSSIANGAIIGTTAGAAGGFVSGAGNAWMNGASFTSGLGSGFSSSMWGAIAGGITGGVLGGIFPNYPLPGGSHQHTDNWIAGSSGGGGGEFNGFMLPGVEVVAKRGITTLGISSWSVSTNPYSVVNGYASSGAGVPENLRRCGMCHSPGGRYYDDLADMREAFPILVSGMMGLYAEGFIFAGLASRITNVVPRTKDVLGHLFRDAIGHVKPTTVASQNRYINLFESVASNSKNINPNVLTNFQRATGGFQGYSKTFLNGKQVWIQTRNGRIIDAGINLSPK